jgi:hypothetical protein
VTAAYIIRMGVCVCVCVSIYIYIYIYLCKVSTVCGIGFGKNKILLGNRTVPGHMFFFWGGMTYE